MNRVIKFRAFNRSLKVMGSALPLDVLLKDTVGRDFKQVSGDLEHMNIMEFTGMRDKNGREIYEGDIVRIENPNEFGSVAFENLAVMWCNHEGNWALTRTPEDPEKPHFIMGGQIRNQIVVGNIYENPELLKSHA